MFPPEQRDDGALFITLWATNRKAVSLRGPRCATVGWAHPQSLNLHKGDKQHMADLFSAEWMQGFQEAWNNEPELAGALGEIGFNSTIGYGFEGEAEPRGFIEVENGRVTRAGAYNGESLNWDLRASPETWNKWKEKGVSMMSLGSAYMTGKLKFAVGDYKAMAKDPRMAGPFVKSFSVMGRV